MLYLRAQLDAVQYVQATVLKKYYSYKLQEELAGVIFHMKGAASPDKQSRAILNKGSFAYGEKKWTLDTCVCLRTATGRRRPLPYYESVQSTSDLLMLA